MDMHKGYDMLVNSEVAADLPMGLRQGHKCCGGCCDMRRAVIIVSIVNCVITLWLIASLAFLADAVSKTKVATKHSMEEYETLEQIQFVILCIKIPFAAAGIYGALKFQVIPVAISLALFVLEFFIGLFQLEIAAILIAFFFAYPHVIFIKEVKEGIMSEENYPIEKHSCCCV